jgi:hypothetical protein
MKKSSFRIVGFIFGSLGCIILVTIVWFIITTNAIDSKKTETLKSKSSLIEAKNDQNLSRVIITCCEAIGIMSLSLIYSGYVIVKLSKQ